MKIKFIGTSNANPHPGIGQSGMILEVDGQFYMFDCGDGVPTKIWLDDSIVMNRINAIFISHFDPDHVGGIFSMLHLMHQRIKRSAEVQPGRNGVLEVYIPDEKAKEHFSQLTDMFHLSDDHSAYRKEFISFNGVCEIYKDERLRVSCFPTLHKKEAHGFVICAGIYKIVYSGDVKEPGIIAPYVENADVLVMEGAHFPIEKIPKAFSSKNIKNIIMTHLLDDRIKNCLKVAEDLKPMSKECNIIFARDNMEVPL